MNNTMDVQVFLKGKRYKVPVIDTINLTEKQPDAAIILQLTKSEISNEKGIFAQKLKGLLLLLIAAIALTLYFYFFKSDNAIFFIGGFIGGVLTFTFAMVIGGLALIGLFLLFKTTKANSVSKAFLKYWIGGYFKAPAYMMSNANLALTLSSNLNDLFFSSALIIENIKMLYPVPIDVDEKKVSQFTSQLSKIITAGYANFPFDEDSELLYGVIYPMKPNFIISKVNETFQSVESNVSIFRLTEKSFKIECVNLNIRMYFVKLGKYWAPVNSISQFAEF